MKVESARVTPEKIDTVACIGGGVIGAGWVARLVENGLSVNIYDPMPDAKLRMQPVFDNADRAYAKLTMAQRPRKGEIIFCDSIEAAVKSAQWIIESVPERLELKQSIYADIENHAATVAVIASSTSGIMPSVLQAQMQHPERLIVAHPFNPVYLLPVVEIVAGQKTSAGMIDRARAFYTLTQILMGEGKKMQLFHSLHHADGRLLATGEHMLIHVSLETRAACEPASPVKEQLARIAALHAKLPIPDGVGRAVGRLRTS